MKFEYDLLKSKANSLKHDIDFEQIQALWKDFDLLEMPARTVGEPRFLLVGRIKNKHWSVIVTYRDNAIRIISARRSRQEEVSLYES